LLQQLQTTKHFADRVDGLIIHPLDEQLFSENDSGALCVEADISYLFGVGKLGDVGVEDELFFEGANIQIWLLAVAVCSQ